MMDVDPDDLDSLFAFLGDLTEEEKDEIRKHHATRPSYQIRDPSQNINWRIDSNARSHAQWMATLDKLERDIAADPGCAERERLIGDIQRMRKTSLDRFSEHDRFLRNAAENSHREWKRRNGGS